MKATRLDQYRFAADAYRATHYGHRDITGIVVNRYGTGEPPLTWMDYVTGVRGFEEEEVLEFLSRQGDLPAREPSAAIGSWPELFVATDIADLNAGRTPLKDRSDLFLGLSLLEVDHELVLDACSYARKQKGESDHGALKRNLANYGPVDYEGAHNLHANLLRAFKPGVLATFHFIHSTGPKDVIGLNRQLVVEAQEE